MNLKQFWPSLSNIDDCIQPEAEVPRFEVLLAAHRSMRFALEQDSQKRFVDEHELLTRFLDPHVQRGTALLIISGSAGVGKSHVIRWLDAQLRAREDNSCRHIIRLPKSTSLKGAISRILEGLSGPGYDNLRGRLMVARDQLNLANAAIVLTANLQIAIRGHVERARGAIASAAKRGDRGQERDRLWATHKALVDVLTDPGLRDRWIGDESAPGVLAKVAERVFKEGARSDDESGLQFKEIDLSFSNEEMAALSPQTAIYLRLLKTNEGKHRREALGLLNNVIDEAANQLLQLGDTGLSDIFDDLRKALLKDKKELIVLIEDFAVLSGMQGALLDALIKEATVGGEQVRCTMRTALAVTTGYELKDTVKTRATGEYLIEDSPYEDDEVAVGAIVDLVGRYLNAARLGSPKLAAAYRSRDAGQSSWVPRFEDTAHLGDEDELARQAFGSDSDGFSLFPFNRAALSQLAKIRFGPSQQSNYRLGFNPRKILQLIRETLVDGRQDFEQGQFPPADFGNANESNRVNADVETAIKQRESDPLKRRRLEALVKFWGDDPASGRPEDWPLPSQILRAFGFRDIGTGSNPLWSSAGVAPGAFGKVVAPPVRDAKLTVAAADVTPAPGGSDAGAKGVQDKAEPAGQTAAEKTSPRSAASNEYEKWRSAIENWRAGRANLLEKEATQLRAWIADDVLSGINWDLEVLPPPKDDFLKDFRRYVFIPKAGTPGNTTEDNCSIKVVDLQALSDRDATLQVALTMQAIVRWKLEGAWSFDIDGAAYARWVQFVESRREQALVFYRNQLNEPILAQAARALYIGTRILNVPGCHNAGTKEMVGAIFTETPLSPASNPVASQRGVTWEGLRLGASEQRKALQEFVLRFIGARQGGEDKVYAIDYSTLALALGDVQTTLTVGGEKAPSTADPDLREMVEHIKQLRNHFSKALADHGASVKQRLVRCVNDLGEAPDKVFLKEQVDEACRLSLTSLSLQLDYSEKLRRSCEQAIALPIEALKAPEGNLDLNATLTHLSAVNGEALKAAENFLGEFHRFGSAVDTRLKAGGLVASAEMLSVEEQGIRNELGLITQLAEITLVGEQPAAAKIKSAAKSSREKQKPVQGDSSAGTEIQTGAVFTRCNNLRKDLKDYGALQQIKEKAEALREHREKIKSTREELNSAKAPWQLLKGHELKGLRNPKCPQAVVSGIPELLRRLKEFQPLNSGQEMAKCLEGATALATSYEQATSDAWKVYRESNLYQGVSVELVRTFQRVAAFASKAFELEKAILVLNEKCENIPQSENDWSECHKAHKKCKELAEKLPLQRLPKQVSAFLLETVAGGAALSGLTKEVKDWIQEHDLENSFVIRAAGSISQPDRLL